MSQLPDDVIVYPGHTAGSPCGKKIGDAPQTTIGQEKRFNYAFQARSKDEFVQTVMEGMPRPPAYYPVMKRVNKVGPTLLRDLPAGKSLSGSEVAAKQAAGALIDARPVDRFAQGHIPGAVSVALGPNFAIWAGWLTPYDREVVLILDEDEQYEDALTELRRIGIDAVAGYLAGGMTAWQRRASRSSAWRRSGSDLSSRLSATRCSTSGTAQNGRRAYIAGAVNAPAGDLAQGAAAPVNGSGPVAVICGTGFRSAVASSLLQQTGKHDIVNVEGGMDAWCAAGLPTGVN